jgi:hypothetical protein
MPKYKRHRPSLSSLSFLLDLSIKTKTVVTIEKEFNDAELWKHTWFYEHAYIRQQCAEQGMTYMSENWNW